MANDDVSPGLYNKISKAFENNLSADKKAQRLADKINNGSATYKDAGKYAERVGNALGSAMRTHLSSETLPNGKMYWHIAEDVIEPLLKEEYSIISTAAAQTQQSLNSSAGMGLKAIKAKYNKTSVENIMGMACNAEQYSVIATLMEETVVTFARDIVDQTVKENVEFQGESGRVKRVIRSAGIDCCAWCADLDGIYEYPNVPEDVYKHHDYCKCSLETEDSGGKRSSIWSSTTPAERDKIEERKSTASLEKKKSQIQKLLKLPNAQNISIPAKQIDVEKLDVDIRHINEVGHNVTETQAKTWVKNAKFSADVWNGQYTRYYSNEGAAYVNNTGEYIKTAYSREEFTQNIIDALEVLK